MGGAGTAEWLTDPLPEFVWQRVWIVMEGAAIVPAAVALVFLGCCANVVFLELLIREEPSSGNIITFFQFLFIAAEGAIFTTNFGCKPSRIPIRRYLLMVAFFFVVNVLNNYSLGFSVPMPLHMIFRAGTLMANMVLGIYLLDKKYARSKYIAVVIITIGISMATIASAHQMGNGEAETGDGEIGIKQYFQLTIGVVLLLTALFTSARMGIYQEVLYRECGKHPREAMFYMHALPLPGFLLLGPDIWSKTISFTASAPLFSIAGLAFPKMWIYILGNCLTQYVCIRGVFVLTTECPSLVVTLVVTLRKFVSLLFSIFYFSNHFTVYHWAATAMVFSGTALFTGLLDSLPRLIFGTDLIFAGRKKVD